MVDAQVEVGPRWLVVGPPYEFTRQELLELLAIMGKPMTERQLRSWAEYNLLPGPIRRVVPPGASDGVARALYPVWTIALLEDLLARSQDNKTIEELREELPRLCEIYAREAEADDGLQLLARRGLVIAVDGQPHATTHETYPPRARALTAWPRVTRSLQRAAWDIVAAQPSPRKPIKRLLLTFMDEDGEQQAAIRIPPPPPPRAKRARKGD